MGNNKKNKRKRVRKEVVYRTEEQRKAEVKEILLQLSKFELTPKYEPVKDLYLKFNDVK